MRDDQPRQLRPIDQDDPDVDARGVLPSIGAEGRCSDEDAPSGPLPLQRPSELLNVRAPNGLLPPLRLEVDQIKAETILLDDAVDPLIT
jgi:hypothetical protein